MQIVKYDPFTDLMSFDTDFEDWRRNGWGLFPTRAETAPLDIFEEDGKMITKVSLPNFTKKDIKVSSNKGILEISAKHRETDEDKGKRHYFVRESNDRYLRRVAMPENVKNEEIDAQFKRGMLTISMPVGAKQTESKLIDIK